MKDKMMARLEELKGGKEKLSAELQKMETQKNQMNADFIAVSGAIQVLEELLKEEKPLAVDAV